jgi:hypothetical protein
VDKSQVVSGGLLKAREDPTKLLELVEKALDEVTLFVEVVVVVALFKPIGFGWYYCLSIHGFYLRYYRITVVTLVGNHSLDLFDLLLTPALQQGFSLGHIVAVSACQGQFDGIAEGIGSSVDFGAEPPFTPPEGFFRLIPPFTAAPEWARTTVASISTLSMSASPEKCSNIPCHTPRSDQRSNRLNTLFHSPYFLGNSRHWALLRATHSTPSTNRLHSLGLPMYTSERVRK